MAAIEPILQHYVTLLAVPVTHQELLPSLLPLFIGLVTIEFYFARHPFEQLGWNSAVSNSVLLIATGASLLFELNLFTPTDPARAVAAYGIILGGLIILLLNFYHVWPPEIAFNLSSALTTYTLAYLAIAIAYTGTSLTTNSLIAATALFCTVWAGLSTVKHLHRTTPDYALK